METVSAVSLQFPVGDCLIQVWVYAFSSSITATWHWYYSLYYLGKKWSPISCPATGAAVFGVWLITRKLISRKFSHNCGYYVTAKKRLLWQAPLSVIKSKKCMILLNSSANEPLLDRRMTREEKNLQLLVVVPKKFCKGVISLHKYTLQS